MQVHRLEDYRIHNRQGRSRGTGGYYVNRMGHKKETDHVKASCVWLKKDAEREEYALDILAGRIYRQGHAWSDFSTEGISENTAYVFDFQGESA